MQSEIVNHLQHASSEDILRFTGINNWEQKSQSYTKTLYNNTLLPYDNDSIYCLDKLHITLKSQESKKKIDYRSLFRSKQQFDLSNWITIIPDNRRQSNYYYSFSVIVEDTHFGKVNFFHTRKNRNCLLEIDNEVLYCQKIAWIIAGVFVIAEAFDLHFNNISVAEIARDSIENLYKQLTEIYYQSVHCSETVHVLYGDHKIYKSVTKCNFEDSPDEKNPSDGVFRIGKSSSKTSMKAYNKTKEIKDKEMKKHYIQKVHDIYLDPNMDVCRVEMTANSGSFAEGGIFGKKEVDLLYMLDKYNLPNLFFALLGDKLVFKDLRTKRWVNGNDIYDTISLIQPPPLYDFDEIPTKLTTKKYPHDQKVDHSKQMINRYLDKEIGFISLADYAFRGLRENAGFAIDFRTAFNKVLTSHKNKIQKQDRRQLEKLCKTLRKNMDQKRGIRARIFLAMLL